MSNASLKAQQKSFLCRASSDGLVAALWRLKDYFPHGRWLGANNKYGRHSLKALTADTNAERDPWSKHLSEYVASSVILHCVNGWSFLGRAVHCHSLADLDQARHLAYYAELRAAMSLLGAEGIGIFNNRHVVVESSGNCLVVPKPWIRTHQFTWLALEHWSGLQRSADLLSGAIRPGGIPLENWLQSFGPSGSGSQIRPIGNKWLTSWGLDLQRFTDDREARNEASYRPNTIYPVQSLDCSESAMFLRNLWNLCEPGLSSNFEALDRHLLRLSLEAAFRAIMGRTVQQANTDYTGWISSLLNGLNFRDGVRDEWESFLKRELDPCDPGLLQEARETSDIRHSRHHLHVIARAALLLRIATAASARLVRDAEYSREELEFWWSDLGLSRGLWASSDEPVSFTDLWQDVRDALDDLDSWRRKNAFSNPPSRATWLQECAHQILTLSQCERVVLWGIGL